jgi:hypothetical protein
MHLGRSTSDATLAGCHEERETDTVSIMGSARLVLFGAIGIVAVCGQLAQRGVRMWPRDVGKPRSNEQQRRVDHFLLIGWTVVSLLAAFGLATSS